MIDPIWLGFFAVLAAPTFMVLFPARFFKRRLSLEEACSVCWVSWSIYMATFAVYVGLKVPLGLGRNTHAPAVAIAVCLSVVATMVLARSIDDWQNAVTKSIFGLFTLILGICAIHFVH